MNDDLKRREEAKRDAHWNPVERWRLIQETIAWADAQAPFHATAWPDAWNCRRRRSPLVCELSPRAML